MKRLICLLLCLLLPLSALAAPTRDMRTSVLSESELDTMRDWLDQTVRAALPLEYDDNTYIGAYVYSCVEDGGCYVLECDVYMEDGDDSLPQFAPDEALTWLCDATLCIKRSGGAYELITCEVGDYYAAADYVLTSTDAYDVNLPVLYSVNDRDVYDYSCYTETGDFVSGIRYRCEATNGLSLQAYADALKAESADMLITVTDELGMIIAEDSGMYMVVCEGNDSFHSLTITYPAEREAEFTLYAEFIRNSFVVHGQSNG